MMRILLAVDETEGSRRASEFVDRFLSDRDAKVTAVNVAGVPDDVVAPVPFGGVFPWRWPLPDESTSSSVDEALATRQAEAEQVAIDQAPSDAEVEAVFGDPVEAIRRAAEDEDADLIVVGSNDKGFLDRLLHRSVSEDLARTAERPVLVVR